ncbi:MAG: AMP-binding protein [Verrucomicrobiales bacterium]|nr:AMP-binding protein [Verrucomicrobiales bacterium]
MPGELKESTTMQVRDEATLSATEMVAMQREAWRETVAYVRRHSPFYREWWDRCGVPPRSRLGLEQRHRLPTLDKRVLSEEGRGLLCVPERRVVDVVTTSGSTGQPLIWRLTEADLERLAANELLSFRCAGVTPSDTVILAVTLDRCCMAGMAYFLGLRRLGASVARVGPSTPAMCLDMVGRLGATAVVGVPSFLAQAWQRAAASAEGTSKLKVRLAVCIGEPVRESGFALNDVGRTLAAGGVVRVASSYGVTELASSLCECEAGIGSHLHPQLLHLEAVDEKGMPVADGEVGELTATTFGVEAMPLIRYRTGDCAAMFHGRCACGRVTPRVGPIVGRKSQKLKFKGVTLFPSTLKSILDSTEGVGRYAIVAHRDGPLSDRVEVRLTFRGDPARVRRELTERFRGEAKVAPLLSQATDSEVESLQFPEGARKRRYFVDLRLA